MLLQCFLYIRYLHPTFIVNKIKRPINFNDINVSPPVCLSKSVTDYKANIAMGGTARNFSQFISSSSRSNARGRNLPQADTFDTHIEEQRGILSNL